MGTHFILDGRWEGETAVSIEDETMLRWLMDTLCREFGFCILSRNIHFFEPQGVTCLYMLSESHVSLHTWPEKKTCSVDVFCCRHLDPVQLEKMELYFTTHLNLTHVKTQYLRRTI